MARNGLARHIGIVGLLSALYFMLFVSGASLTAFSSLLYLVLTGGFFFLGSLGGWVSAAAWLVLCLLTGFAHYFTAVFGALINRASVTVLMQATPWEIDAFSYVDILPYLLPGLLLGLGGWLLRKSGWKKRSRLDNTLLVMAGLLLVQVASLNWSTLGRLPPYNIVSATYNYWRYVINLDEKMRSRTDLGEYVDADAFRRPAHGKPLLVVLVIGESARGDHFSLNGYGRDTNPYTKHIENLVSFPKAYSCGVMTYVSVPCLLTRATGRNKQPMYHEKSLISVFNRLGFETVWVAAQGNFSDRNPITYISGEAHKQYFFVSLKGTAMYDEEVLPYVRRYAAEGKDTLLILHLQGSHFTYAHYPDRFRRFTPTCARPAAKKPFSLQKAIMGKTGSQNQLVRWFLPRARAQIRQCAEAGWLVNSYDNTILYTDWVLSQVIGQLQGTNALLMYVSDHGESLGEHGKFMHGYVNEESNWHVPMLWWASADFIRDHPAKWKALAGRVADTVNQDNLFHSVLDCAGIRSGIVNPHKSLCHVRRAGAK